MAYVLFALVLAAVAADVVMFAGEAPAAPRIPPQLVELPTARPMYPGIVVRRVEVRGVDLYVFASRSYAVAVVATSNGLEVDGCWYALPEGPWRTTEICAGTLGSPSDEHPEAVFYIVADGPVVGKPVPGVVSRGLRAELRAGPTAFRFDADPP